MAWNATRKLKKRKIEPKKLTMVIVIIVIGAFAYIAVFTWWLRKELKKAIELPDNIDILEI